MSFGDVHVPGHIHTPLYEHGFLDSQEIFAKPPMDVPFLSFYPFFVCLLFSQAVIVALGSYNVKQLTLIIFNKHPGSVQFLSHVGLSVTPWTAACQTSLSITNSQSLLKLMSITLMMPPTISSSVVPFSSHLQSFPASGIFPVSRFFASGGQCQLQHQTFQ